MIVLDGWKDILSFPCLCRCLESIDFCDLNFPADRLSKNLDCVQTNRTFAATQSENRWVSEAQIPLAQEILRGLQRTKNHQKLEVFRKFSAQNHVQVELCVRFFRSEENYRRLVDLPHRFLLHRNNFAGTVDGFSLEKFTDDVVAPFSVVAVSDQIES